MKKFLKKSVIHKYIQEGKSLKDILESDLEEFVDVNGTLIDANDNYKATTNDVKSKKTTDDFVRSATQGPEAYFVYGGPYYGVNYSYIVNEDEELLEQEEEDEISKELDVVPSKYSRSPEAKARKLAVKDIKKHFHDVKDPFAYYDKPSEEWPKYAIPFDTEFDFEIDESKEKMKSLVDEILTKRRIPKDVVQRTNEEDLMHDVEIPEIGELKKTYEKPIVVRKLNSLMDIINKEGIYGDQVAIILNHLLNSVDISKIDKEHRELLGDKLKYGEQERE
jgi:hypothetical protein